MSSPLGRVVQFPVRHGAGLAESTANTTRAAFRRVTEEPSGHVDDWGRDAGLFRAVTMLSEIRWAVSTGGDQYLPARKGALIVVNARRFSMAHIYSAFAISRAVDRPVRFVGRPDDTTLGALAQRLGGLLDHPDEVAGALRAGELVVSAAASSSRPREVGNVDHTIIGAAVASGVDLFPAATTSSPFSRRARIEIGPAIRGGRRRRGPLAEYDLAHEMREQISLLLTEMGDINTGTPLDWLPLSGLGGN
jgi:hypothetical protein